MRYSLSVTGYGLAVLFTGALLTACVSEDFLGDAALQTDGAGQIVFQSGTAALTRSTQTGADAAAALNGHFVVYGTKHAVAEDNTAANDAMVFNHYNVQWADESAGTSMTNTGNWDYVGGKSYSAAVASQTAKIWDLDAANGYTFYAFSTPKVSYPLAAADSVTVTKIAKGTDVHAKGYNLSFTKTAALNGLYFSDRKTVAKADYGKPVQLTFRPFGVKVRVGFYETIPGYTVKINRFYYLSGASAPITAFGNMVSTSKEFRAALPNVRKDQATTKYTITYNSQGNLENQPVATYTKGKLQYNLTLGTNCYNTNLSESSAAPTYDQADGAYTDFYPYEAVTNPMLILCDYTITSQESTSESLTVTGAKVIVPSEFVNWKMGHTYTYLFKISMSSSGTTGTSGSDPDGLYPISFYGVEISTASNDQTILTSIDKFNVTTYRNSGNVYVVNTGNDGSVIIPSKIGDESGQAQLYYVTTTGDDIDETTTYARLIGASNGLTLEPVKISSVEQAGQFAAQLVYEVPAGDGTTYTFGTQAQPGVLKFTPESGHAYAYVYCETKHVNPTYTVCTQSSVYDPGTTYYVFQSGLYVAQGVTESEFNAGKTNYFTQTSAGTTGKYAVMILDTRTSSK